MGISGVVEVYGVDHSPWVQGVLLALHHHGVPHRLRSLPFGLGWTVRRGLVFPAVRLDGGPVLTDSFAIYEALEDAGCPLGLEEWSPEQRTAVQVELERLFTGYALARCIRGRRWAFFKAWSTMREHPPSRYGAAVRAALSVYFFVLIRLGILQRTRRGRPAVDPEAVARHLSAWDARLTQQPWLTGPAAGFLDFAVLGHLQCMASGLTDEWVDAVRQHPALCAWLDRMLSLPSSLPAAHAARILRPAPPLSPAPVGERVWFWAAWGLAVGVWPLTLVLVLGALVVRSRNPGHSGAVLARVRRAAAGTTGKDP